MGRSPCCSKEGLNRGAWTSMEDKILTEYIKLHGEGKWRSLPKRAGLKRCGKSCRLRWLNYLRPDIKRGNITRDEEELIIRLHNLLGNRWSLIAGRLPGRTDNEIKNYWNTNIVKKLRAPSLNSKTTSRKVPSSNRYIWERLPKPKTTQSKIINPTSSPVVKTKATRCTKAVFLPQDLQNKVALLDHNQIMSGGSSSNTDDHGHEPAVDDKGPSAVDNYDQLVNDQTLGLRTSLTFDVQDKSNSFPLINDIVDFETDQENFLSEFLNIDFGFSDDVAGEISSSNHKGFSSCSKSDHENETLLFSQDMFGVDYLESAMASSVIVNPADINWLQDQSIV